MTLSGEAQQESFPSPNKIIRKMYITKSYNVVNKYHPFRNLLHASIILTNVAISLLKLDLYDKNNLRIN